MHSMYYRWKVREYMMVDENSHMAVPIVFCGIYHIVSPPMPATAPSSW